MQSDRDARIRDRAYQIWLEEGRMHGKEQEHWQRAEREIAAEDARTSSGARPRRSFGGAAKAAISTSPLRGQVPDVPNIVMPVCAPGCRSK